MQLIAKRRGKVIAKTPETHVRGGQPRAQAASEPTRLADEAEPEDEGAGATEARLVGHRRRGQRHDRVDELSGAHGYALDAGTRSVPLRRRGGARARPARGCGSSARSLRRPGSTLGVVGPGTVQQAAGLNGYPAPSQPTPQADLGVPAEAVTMIGASSREPGAPAARDVGRGRGQRRSHDRPLLRPSRPKRAGRRRRQLDGRADPPRRLRARTEGESDPLEGQVDPEGYGVLAGEIPVSGSTQGEEVLLVRKPGGGFQATTPPATEGEEPPLGSGHTLLNVKRWPMIAPLHEADGEAGALVAPVDERRRHASTNTSCTGTGTTGRASRSRSPRTAPTTSVCSRSRPHLRRTRGSSRGCRAKAPSGSSTASTKKREWAWQPVEGADPGRQPPARARRPRQRRRSAREPASR